MKKIIFTGGGSAGHVTVNLALIPYFLKNEWQVAYIGSNMGIEKKIISNRFPNTHYFCISTGKFRRYFSLKNLSDPFRVVKGVLDAFRILKREEPSIIFSKGGFVAVPVVIAAKMLRIPVIIHESDMTPGLANRISISAATKIFTTFSETLEHVPEKKSQYVGAIIRQELFNGNKQTGLLKCGFTNEKSVLLIMGGSLGAKKINEQIRNILPELLTLFQIIHICGEDNIDENLKQKGYCQFEYVNEELPDLISTSDVVISRAGSNSIFEFLALKKPMLLIPLSKHASRGDQILNAKAFVRKGYAIMLEEEGMTNLTLLNDLKRILNTKENIVENMNKIDKSLSIQDVYNEIVHMSKQKQ
jgi:UDP-N-acetylglucosamine--N-acetylmuramyl-(pentapeptide) pyrophosphoryl-undecaprenol N-acetylglucosamine transferase